MNIDLSRHGYLPMATLGWLKAGPLRLATLEEPWRRDPDGPGGQRREGALLESCVQDGAYRLIPHSSARFPNVWALVNEKLGVYAPGQRPPGQNWGRDAILIHAGNTTEDITGCIAVGMRHGWEGGKPAVYESRVALDRLRAVLGREEHTLIIRPTAGTAEIAA